MQDICHDFPMLKAYLDQWKPIDTAILRREGLETSQRRVEKPDSSSQRSPFHMVIRRSNLNETLQKLMRLARGVQPDLLPLLVRLPELAVVEALDSPQKMGDEIRPLGAISHARARRRAPR